MHVNFELLIALFCLVFGVLLHRMAPRSEGQETLFMGLTDMQFLGLMIWVAGIVLVMDCKWHFLTEPEH